MKNLYAPRRGQKWTTQEDETLKELYGKIETKKLAENLQRTHRSVQERAYVLGLTKKAPDWTEEEIKSLLEVERYKDHKSRSATACKDKKRRLKGK